MTLPWIALVLAFSPLWWLLILIASGILIRCLEEDDFIPAFIVVAVTTTLMVVFGSGMEHFNWVRENWVAFFFWGDKWYLPGVVPGYIALGAIWGVIKWYFFVCNKLDEYETTKYEWLKSQGVDAKEIPDSLKVRYLDWIVKNTGYARMEKVYDDKAEEWIEKPVLRIKPRGWENKAKITAWMAYWPWSFFWTMLADFFKQIFRHIQRLLGNFLDVISNFVFRNVDKDFEIGDAGEKAADMVAKRNKEEKAREEVRRQEQVASLQNRMPRQ